MNEVSKEKSGIGGLVLVLVAMVLFAIYQFILVPYVFTKEEPEVEKKEPEKTEAEILAELAEEFHLAFDLSYEEESVYTLSDIDALMDKMTVTRMSNELKIYFGIKNVDAKYITKDGGYSAREALQAADGNFYYGGTYIMLDPIEAKIRELFGNIPYQHQSITLNNTKYVYKEAKNMYEVWIPKVKEETDIEKITYKEVITTSKEILIYYYVAYTDFSDPEEITSGTLHYPSIDVVITEDNVKDYLSYMDKFKYTFEKAADGNFYFKSIEYVNE